MIKQNLEGSGADDQPAAEYNFFIIIIIFIIIITDIIIFIIIITDIIIIILTMVTTFNVIIRIKFLINILFRSTIIKQNLEGSRADVQPAAEENFFIIIIKIIFIVFMPGLANLLPKLEQLVCWPYLFWLNPKLQNLLGTQVTFHRALLLVMFCEANYKMFTEVH